MGSDTNLNRKEILVGNTGFTHELPHTGETVVWLTPPDIIKSLGEFDLDPCAAIDRPWDIARKNYTIIENGLTKKWGKRRVFCNPPYGPDTSIWLQKCYLHNNSVALVFARTETKAFQQWVWGKADAMLFIHGRVKFYKPDGTQGKSAGAPSVLIAYGKENAKVLKACGIKGSFVNVIQD